MHRLLGSSNLILATLLWFSGYNIAYAQLAQNLTVGNAKALALANAVTADPPGIDSIHYNPAGLGLLHDRQFQFKLITGQFTIAGELTRSEELQQLLDSSLFDDPITNGKSETSDVSVMLPFTGLTEIPVLLAPLGGVSLSSPDKRYTFANAVYSQMMVGYNRGEGDIARYEGNQLGLTHLTYFSPSIAVRLNDQWLVGATLAFNYTGVGIDLDMRVPNAILGAVESLSDITCEDGNPIELWQGLLDLCQGSLGPFSDIGNLYLEVEDHFNPSINIGALWQPKPWFSWGFVYQSEAKTELKGDFAFDYSEDWYQFFQGLNISSIGHLIALGLPIPEGVPKEKGSATLEFTVPSHFSTGISVLLLPYLKVNMDAKWTDTAAWEEFKIEFDQTLDFLNILSLIAQDTVSSRSLTFPRGYKSTWSWALGLEYYYDTQLSLRLGYEDRPSSIPKRSSDLLAPFGDAFLAGAGIAYRMDKDSLVDLGFGVLKSTTSIPANSSTNVNSTGIDNLIYNPYAGYHITTSVTAYLFELSYHTTF